jgi:hypothetical protein
MRQSPGTTPVSSDFWNIGCSSGDISVASSFRILGDMLSDPGALYGFSCFSNFVILLQVISKDFIFGCCVVVEFIRFEFRNSSVVYDVFSEKADLNWRFNIFDLVTGSQYSLPSIFSDEIPTMSLGFVMKL